MEVFVNHTNQIYVFQGRVTSINIKG